MLSLHQLIQQNKQKRNFYDEFTKKSQTHTKEKSCTDTSKIRISIRKNVNLTSHFTAYACAIEGQEIATKYLINKRQRSEGKTPTISTKYILCKQISKTSLISSAHVL